MKKTQLKDTIRNIRKELVSYLSILIIALLAVTAFLGINFASTALRNCADHFYDEYNYRDIEITSTMLLSGEDIEAFKNTEGVERVEGVYYINGKIQKEDAQTSIGVVSLPEELNTLTIVKGRLPESTNECVMESELLDFLKLKIGDRIKVTDSSGQLLTYLLGTDYVITGSVIHGDHYARQEYVPGERYILINKEAFDIEKLDGCYMKAEIRAEGTRQLSRFSKNYDKIVDALKERLSPLNKELAAEREASVRKTMQDKIDEGEQKLADGKKKLDDGRKELDDNAKKLEDGEKELANAKQKLDEGAVLIQNGEEKLAAAAGQLSDGKAKLDAAKAQLDAGQQKLDDAAAQLASAKEKLDSGWAALEDGKKKLDDANAQLTDTYNQAEEKKGQFRDLIKDAVTELIGEEEASKISWAKCEYITDANDPNLMIGNFAITENININLMITIKDRVEELVLEVLEAIGQEEHYDEVISRIENTEIFIDINNEYNEIVDKLNQWTDARDQYIEGLKTYQDKLAEYNNGLAEYNNGLALYDQGLTEFNSKKAEYEQGLALYNNSLAEYNEGRALLDEKIAEYNQGLAAYNDGVAKLEEGRSALKDGEAEYAKGKKEYDNGVEELNNAKKQLEDLPNCYFIMLDQKGNGGFVHAEDAAANVGKVGITFAFIFILVGALVIYVTLGRIIGEQRTLVGAQKALGFFSREILTKYILFGMSATLIGMLLGTAIGYLLIQRIITNTYGRFYIVDRIQPAFRTVLFVVVIVAGLILSAIAVWWACRSLLKQTARELMQYELPKGKKKSAANSGEKGSSLYSRLIFRNIVTDWKRVLITIVSIAGCCTLLVIGFHMRDGINKTLSSQFDRIMKYDLEISFSPDISKDAEQEITDALAKKGVSSYALTNESYAYDSDGDLQLARLYVGDQEDLQKGFLIEPASKKEPFGFSDNGVIIPQKIAEAGKLKAGDKITMYDKDMTPHKIEITGVFDNYLGWFFFMTEESFRNNFGSEPVDNVIQANTDLNKKAIDKLLGNIKGYTGVTLKSDMKQTYGSLTKVLTLITLVLIVAAGMMAYFVLLNLVNMYLNRKKRELVVMRINGFTTNEVLRYVAMESVVTTIAGIILGLALGTALGNIILKSLEQGVVKFFSGISFSSWLFSAVLTIVFSAIINAIALRKVKHLKLNDM